MRPSDQVDVQAKEFGEHCSSEIKDESQGRGESVEVKPKEIVQDESIQEKDDNLLDVPSGDSAEKMEKPSLESPSELSAVSSKSVDEKIEEKTEEEVTLHQESQEEGSYGLETKEETISVPESSELGVKSEEESCQPNEQEKETKLHKQMEKHESTSEEDTNAQKTHVEEKYDEVIQVSSASPSEEREGETVVEAEKIENIKANEEEQVTDKIQRNLETVETVEPHSSFPPPPEEHGTVADAEKKDLELSETKDWSLPLEASRSDGTESSELVAESEEQKPKQVKEIGEIKELDETKAETIPQETLSDVVAVQIKREEDATQSHERQDEVSKAVEAKETTVAQEEQTRDIGTSLTEKCSMDQTQPDEQVNEECYRDKQEEVRETKTKVPKDEHVDSSENNDNETLIAETKKEDEDITVGLDCSDTSKTSENVCIKQEEFENLEAPKLEESKEDKKSQEISETIEAIEATGDHTPSFISELEDKIPKQVEEIHEEETKEEHKEEAASDQNLPVEASHEDQTSKQVEEIHEEEETKETSKVEATSDQNHPAETSQEHQSPSSELVSGLDDKTPKQIEEIHEEETKAQKLQDEEILPTEIVPRESFPETPVSMLASKEDDQVQEGNCAGDTQEEQHVSAETLKPGEIIEEQDENSDDFTFSKETGEPEHGDETSSSLPVVGILTQLQSTLENERAINDSASSEENLIIEPEEQVQETGDAEAESSGNDLHSIKEEPETLKKHLATDISEPVAKEKPYTKVTEEAPASEIIEANKLQHDESGETEKIHEENGLAGKSLPIEELNLQEEHKEEGKVQDVISREFEVSVEEKLQKEETREIAEPENVVSAEKQEERKAPQDDANASTAEKISLRDFEISKKTGDSYDQVIESELPADPPQIEQKAETHETVKEKDQIVDIKEDKKNEEVQDEKLRGLYVTRESEEISSEVKKDKEDSSELGVGHDLASPEVEKEKGPDSVLENEEEINEVATSAKQITEPPSEAEKESKEEHVETEAISDDTKNNNDRDFPTEQTAKDQREEVEAHTKDKETSGQEQKSNDLTYVQEDNGTNVKLEDVHDSIPTQKEETGLIEEKREVGYVKTELEDAIKHGISVEEVIVF